MSRCSGSAAPGAGISGWPMGHDLRTGPQGGPVRHIVALAIRSSDIGVVEEVIGFRGQRETYAEVSEPALDRRPTAGDRGELVSRQKLGLMIHDFTPPIPKDQTPDPSANSSHSRQESGRLPGVLRLDGALHSGRHYGGHQIGRCRHETAKTPVLSANTHGGHGWAISTAVPRTMEGSVKPEHSRFLCSGFSDSLSVILGLE